MSFINEKAVQVPVSDGFHYFRVRSFRGALMFYFNFGFVGYYEAPENGPRRAVKSARWRRCDCSVGSTIAGCRLGHF